MWDTAEAWQLGFQDAATPVMEEITHLHDQILFYLILIITSVTWILYSILTKFTNKTFSHKFMTHGTTIEIIWTIAPAFILISIAFPSFKLLYLMDEVIDPIITIKTIGRQWYWTYEYSDYVSDTNETLSYDSYMIPTNELETGTLRLLEVDNRVVVPTNVHVRFIITAGDVLHSWAVPSLGVKVDAVPGRLNQTSVYIKRPGVYYGQCSEICGYGHGFMPIVIEAVSKDKYIDWIVQGITEK